MTEIDNLPTIYDSTKTCSDLFAAYLESRQVSDDNRDAATDLSGRFKLWIEYVGALAPPKASLDARLVDHDDIKSMFLELLDMVQRNIRQDLYFSNIEAADQAEQPGSTSGSASGSGSDSDDGSLVCGLDAVADAVGRLHSLAVAVRRSSATKSNKDKWNTEDTEDTEDKVGIAQGAQSSEARSYIEAMRTRFPHARSSLVDRLGMSIYVRGQAMYYQQRHNKKLRFDRDQIQIPTFVQGSSVPPTIKQHSLSSQSLDPARPTPICVTDDFSDTNASPIQTEQLHYVMNRPRPSLSQISIGSSIKESDMEGFGYPRKPLRTGSAIAMESCPLCAEPLNLALLTDKKWHDHVDKDMEQYICISEDCGSKIRFFSSYNDWKTHMQANHSMAWPWTTNTTWWKCDLDGENNNYFGDKDKFLKHLNDVHGDRLTTSQILIRVRRNKVTRDREPFTCPLCDRVPDDKNFVVSEKPYELLYKHIARHLKAVAFFSLNYLDLESSAKSFVSHSVKDDAAGGSIAAVSDRDDDFALIPQTILTKSEVRVNDLIFTFAGSLDDSNIAWPPPGLVIEFNGPDTTLQNFAEARRNEAKSLVETQPSPVQVDGRFNTSTPEPSLQGVNWTPQDWKLFNDIHHGDPRSYKEQFEQWKGGNIRDVYLCLLHDFHLGPWLGDPDTRVLWITGDTGTGKTMLMCGIINELRQFAANSALCYLFCAHYGRPSNDSMNIARGLMYMLVLQRPALISHARRITGTTFEMPAKNANILFSVLRDMLADERATGAILMVDDAYEGLSGPNRSLLFTLIRLERRVRWVITSRNSALVTDDIGLYLEDVPKSAVYRLVIEKETLQNALSAFIRHKVNNTAGTHGYNKYTTAVMIQHLTSHHDGSFRWADMACRAVAGMLYEGESILQNVFSLTQDISCVCRQLIENIQRIPEAGIYRDILAVASTAYRPLSILELCTLCPTLASRKTTDVERILGLYVDILEVRNETVYFRDETIKDFIIADTPHSIFPLGLGDYHLNMAFRSIDALSNHLRQDICGINDPGRLRHEISIPDDSPLPSIRYACIYWVDHLRDAGKYLQDHDTSTRLNLRDNGYVHSFLRYSFLQWLETLYLIEGASSCDNILAILSTLKSLQFSKLKGLRLRRLIDNALNFVSVVEELIGEAPLQIYVSAFLFCPKRIMMWKYFHQDAFTWVRLSSAIADIKDIKGQGRDSSLTLAIFSRGGERLATVSTDHGDHTIELWDPYTGRLLKLLKGHHGDVLRLVFSADGRRLAAVADSSTVRIWDTESDTRSPVLTVDDVSSSGPFTFSPDGLMIAYMDSQGDLILRDTSTGKPVKTFGYSSYGFDDHKPAAVEFSSDSKLLGAGSFDQAVKVWDLLDDIGTHFNARKPLQTRPVVFSQDGTQVAAIARENSATAWDIASGQVSRKFSGDFHSFSPETLAGGGWYSRYQVRDKWVIRDGRRLVYLPDSWNLRCLDISGNCVALGDNKGGVHFLHFDEEIEF